MTGHALAVLARTSGAEPDRQDAHDRLTRAVDGYDHATHIRARAPCTTGLALLHLDGGDPEQAAHWTRHALAHPSEVHSARLHHDLATIRSTTAGHDQPALTALAADIDTANRAAEQMSHDDATTSSRAGSLLARRSRPTPPRLPLGTDTRKEPPVW